MRTDVVGVSCALAVAALTIACPGTLENPERFRTDASTSCTDPPQDVFKPRCATSKCHDSATKTNGLDLEAPDVEGRLSGKKATGGPGLLIDPGSPDTSILYLKLKDPAPFGGRMPSAQAKLDDKLVACVRTWIISMTPIDAGSDASVSDSDDSGGAD